MEGLEEKVSGIKISEGLPRLFDTFVRNGTAGKAKKPCWKCLRCKKTTINREQHLQDHHIL